MLRHCRLMPELLMLVAAIADRRFRLCSQLPCFFRQAKQPKPPFIAAASRHSGRCVCDTPPTRFRPALPRHMLHAIIIAAGCR